MHATLIYSSVEYGLMSGSTHNRSFWRSSQPIFWLMQNTQKLNITNNRKQHKNPKSQTRKL